MKSKRKLALKNKEFLKEVEKFLVELDNKISEDPFFEFWEYLDKAKFLEKIKKNSILGNIEKNVSIRGKLILGENSTLLAGTYIEGNVFIGKNCKIGPNAYLRGNTIVADNCHVANSEIKNSIILENSKVPHFSYVGDSILGKNVNLGAGTKVANLRFDSKNIFVSLRSEEIDSKRRKLGCMIGHNSKIGVNCSINCGLIIGNNCFIYPGKILMENLDNNSVFK